MLAPRRAIARTALAGLSALLLSSGCITYTLAKDGFRDTTTGGYVVATAAELALGTVTAISAINQDPESTRRAGLDGFTIGITLASAVGVDIFGALCVAIYQRMQDPDPDF